MFVQRQAQRSSMHARHLNEQLVRVLKTIGYDVGFKKGQGQYLYDRDDVRYLDLLSGFGVFAIGRNHPALREALKSVLDADLPNLVQLDVSTLAGVLAERLLKYVPYLDKVFFANSGAETVEAAIKFARGATGPARHRALRAFLPRPVLWRAVADGRREFPQRLRAAAAGMHRDSLQRSRSARAGAVVARGRRLHRRADPGQGRQHAHRRVPAGRGRALQEIRHAVHRRRNPDRHRAHRPLPRRSSTGMSSPTWCCSQRRCPAAMCRSARC